MPTGDPQMFMKPCYSGSFCSGAKSLDDEELRKLIKICEDGVKEKCGEEVVEEKHCMDPLPEKKAIPDTYNTLKTSGKEDTFSTGAVRDVSEMKGAYELISPLFLRRLALHLERGAKRYKARNWEAGMPMGRTIQSLIRHTFQYLEGDRSEDHLGGIACNIMFLIHYEEAIARGLLPESLNDLPNFMAPDDKA